MSIETAQLEDLAQKLRDAVMEGIDTTTAEGRQDAGIAMAGISAAEVVVVSLSAIASHLGNIAASLEQIEMNMRGTR